MGILNFNEFKNKLYESDYSYKNDELTLEDYEAFTDMLFSIDNEINENAALDVTATLGGGGIGYMLLGPLGAILGLYWGLSYVIRRRKHMKSILNRIDDPQEKAAMKKEIKNLTEKELRFKNLFQKELATLTPEQTKKLQKAEKVIDKAVDKKVKKEAKNLKK